MGEAVDYYKIAIDWAEAYLRDNTEPKEIKIEAGICRNDLQYVEVAMNRIKEGVGKEKYASYNRLRKFKKIIENK